ncbi:MAG: type II toxin-antitoxin system HicB family antitoxin [Acidobacteriota bacterium]|nr:type II toxin-antitoxin system HicB family antitoxin [Acidobacteriota bacterium]
MKTVEYTFWKDGEFFLGYLNEYPDYQTQAYSKEELLENLKDLLKDVESENIPFIRKVEELEIA